MSEPSWDYIAKVVCIGDSATGKSSLSVRLCEGRFSQHHDVTIGVEFSSLLLPVGPAEPHQKHLKLSLWDTAGQETYKSVTRSYFRGAGGAMLVFDLTRRATFESAASWLTDLRAIAEEGVVVVLVGNKLDLCEDDDESNEEASSKPTDGGAQPKRRNKRDVTRAEAEAWCKENNVLQYVETSAKSGANVEDAFLIAAQKIYEGIEAGRYDLEDRRSGVKAAQSMNNSSSYGNGRGDVSLSKRKNNAGGGCC